MKKEVLIKFYSTYRLIVFPAVVGLSSLFLIVFAIYPQTVKLITNQKVSGEIADKSKFLQSKADALESYDGADLSRKVELVLRAYPAEKDFGNILELLQQKIAQLGFSTTSISLGNTSSKGGNVDSYEVKLEIQGARVLLATLLDNLENSTRLMRVKSIDVSSGTASQGVSAQLVVEVLYSKLPQSFGTADSPLPSLSEKDDELLASLEETSKTVIISVPPEVISSSPRGKSNPFE